jgi:hypothetical protein
MQINWSFPQFVLTLLPDRQYNAVVGTKWICTGIKDGLTAAMDGEVIFTEPNPAAGMAPEQITQEMLDEWVSKQLNMAEIEGEVADRLNNFSPP